MMSKIAYRESKCSMIAEFGFGDRLEKHGKIYGAYCAEGTSHSAKKL